MELPIKRYVIRDKETGELDVGRDSNWPRSYRCKSQAKRHSYWCTEQPDRFEIVEVTLTEKTTEAE